MFDFELHIDTDPDPRVIRFRLTDRHGTHLAAHQVRLADHDAARWAGLLDTRQHIRRLAAGEGPDEAAHALATLGVFLGRDVLGSDITRALIAGHQRRTLCVRLPDTAPKPAHPAGDPLAAALARVPWELARWDSDDPDLLARGVVVLVTTGGTPDRDAHVAAVARQVADGQTALRVLLVSADTTDGSALAWRREREHLLDLFAHDILPNRKVEIDVVCYGVTRALLQERITASGGYHIIHWSGHGLRDQLELRGEDGEPERITGDDLVALIAATGGFVPQLVVLSACLSGTMYDVGDPDVLLAVLDDDPADGGEHANTDGEQADAGAAARTTLADLFEPGSGYTATALALVHAGVPQVVAMRYRVSDAYARELARAFYQRLLADRGRPSTEGALHLARLDVGDRGSPAARRAIVDRFNPIAFGHAGRLLDPVEGRSDQLRRWRPRPQPVLSGSDALDSPAQFVGRTAELTRLHLEWLARGGPGLALVLGGPGMGKTQLAAEVVHAWHRRFVWVLAFAASGPGGAGSGELRLDAFHRQVHDKLVLASAVYRRKCEDSPYERVYLDPGQPLEGAARFARMRINLIEALRDEAVLLVLDGFEANLESIDVMGEPGHRRCTDPAWNELLVALARELPPTRSRALITSRFVPAALTGATVTHGAGGAGIVDIRLAPLSRSEAGLFVRAHDALGQLARADEQGVRLCVRVIERAAGHPGELARLATLATNRAALAAELDRLGAR